MENIGKYLPGTMAEFQLVHFTEWMPRQGDNAVFTYEEILLINKGDLTVQVFTKNSEDAGPGTLVGTIDSNIGSGSRFYEKVMTGLEELVRYGISVNEDEESFGSGAVYRILPPNWFNAARGAL